MTRFFPLVLLALCTLGTLVPLAGGEVSAQTQTILLQCRPGFGDLGPRSRTNGWIPFRVDLMNTGSAVSGSIVISATLYSGKEIRFAKRVELAGGARQSHELLVQTVYNLTSATASFESGGERLAEVPVSIAQATGAPDLHLAVVDREQTALNDISSVQIPAVITRPPFTSAPADLPRHWLGYDMLDAIVLNDAPLLSLDPAQVTALKRWVASGGTLVVAGGADFSRLRGPDLAWLLPVEVAERRTVGAVPGLVSTYGEFSGAGGALVAVGAARTGARVLLESDGLPIVAEQAYGIGRVRFVAIDPKLAPYRGWVGAPALWVDVLAPSIQPTAAHERRAAGAFGGFGNLGELLHELAGIRPPFVGYYFTFLFVYLITIGPANYLVLRAMRRLELAWLTIPALVLVFTLGTVVAAHVSRGVNSVVVASSVAQYFEHEGVSLIQSKALVVPAGKSEYRLGLPEGSVGSDIAGVYNPGSTESTVLDETDSASSLTTSMKTWETRYLEVVGAADEAPPVRVRILGGEVTVTNTGPDRLHGVVVVAPSGVYRVGEVAPGADGRSAAPAFFPTAFASWYPSELATFPNGRRFFESFGRSPDGTLDTLLAGSPGALPHGFFTVLPLEARDLAVLTHPVLFAVGESDRAPVSLDGGTRAHSLSLVVFHLKEGRP